MCPNSCAQHRTPARTPASSATPSHLHRYVLLSAPGSTVKPTPVDYACHGHAPRPNPNSIHHGNAKFEELRPCSTAEQGRRRAPPLPRAPSRFQPSDPAPAVEIRSRNRLVCAARSGSDGSDLEIPFRPDNLAKESLSFSRINPRSTAVQK